MIENTSSMDRTVAAGRNPRRVALISAVGVAAIVILALVIPTATRWMRADRAVDATSLRFATVTRGDLLRDLSLQGRVVAALSPTLFSPGQGIVTVRAIAGTNVRKDEVLATIASPELEAALDQARSQALSAAAELERQRIVARQSHLRGKQAVDLMSLRLAAAKRQLERVERTFKEGLSNKADYESAQDALQIASMELEQAKSELALSSETLSFETETRMQQLRRQQSVVDELGKRVADLTIRAPFDGMVASFAVQDRDAVAANQPIVTVVNLSSLELEIGLPEEYANETAIGTPATISFAGRDYAGRVTAVSPEVVNSQVTARVAFDGHQPEGLKQNQRITTRLTFESKKNVLKVPRGAFLESGAGRVAWVVDGEMATRREIETGAVSAGEVEVVKGLKQGETIIVSDTTAFGDAKTVMLR